MGKSACKPGHAGESERGAADGGGDDFRLKGGKNASRHRANV